MKLVHCWPTAATIAATLILAASRLLAADNLTTPEAGVDSPDLSDTDQRDFRVSLLGLFNAGRYADLDALAQQLQQQRSRFKGGAWRLHVFFGTLSTPGAETATDAAWKMQSSEARKMGANQSGLSDSAHRIGTNLPAIRLESPRPWICQHRYTGGLGIVQGARAAGPRDTRTIRCFAENSPHWYLEMQGVALDQEWNRTAFDALAERALAHEPSYYYFATSESNYLLPKWYGKPGDTERYAAEVADRVGGEQGDAVYFQIASAINCCNRTQALMLSWPRVQRGFAATESLFHSTNHQRNVMAFLAVRNGDSATAQQLFGRIGNDWSKVVWKTKSAFDAARMGNAVTLSN